jgi:hypothetical protein
MGQTPQQCARWNSELDSKLQQLQDNNAQQEQA